MYLYHIPIQSSQAIHQAIAGNFSGTKSQEICVARGSQLEIHRPDTTTGKLLLLLSWECFAVIRCVAPFRLTGGSKDYILVGSDTGKLIILEFNAQKNQFQKVHDETFGKTGLRRVVPGQFLAVDPKGRAAMIGAIEKQKLVYILNRDAASNLTISSPLEAHKSQTLLFHCVGVDCGYENPLFACIELDYSEIDQDPTGEALNNTDKVLTYYELDLGLNHVVRKWSEPVDPRSNMLIQVPGGADGPGGVLVCAENVVAWKHQGHSEVKVPIPRREHPLDDPSRGLLIVSSAMHKKKNVFFFVLQSEEGDLYRLTLTYEADRVTDMKIKYLDTIPVTSSMCILKSGFLFAASEFGNHGLYQIQSLGEDDTTVPEYSAKEHGQPDEDGSIRLVYFTPRSELQNFIIADDIDSLCPIVDCKIEDTANEETPQFYAVCGRGSRSTLRILRNGLEVTDIASSDLNAHATGIWTVKTNSSDAYDSYIVVSFVNATLVLSIGETVTEVSDSGFLSNTPTISVSRLGEDSLLQIYADGIRHIRADKRISEWKAPQRKTILQATANERQVAVALSGGELVYFELDERGQLSEYQERREMSANVTCMTIGPIPTGRQRCRFLAVGCDDSTVRILSVDPEDCLQALGMQALPTKGIAQSLCMLDMAEHEQSTSSTLYLNIGLQNGVLLRTIVDQVTGVLSDTRTRFLGSRPVKLFKIRVQQLPAVLALSSRPWLSYTYQSRFHLTPLSCSALDFASNFCSEQCPEGVVATSEQTLRFLAIEKLGGVFNQVVVPLSYTPRRIIIHPQTKYIVTVESDRQTHSPAALARQIAARRKPDEDEMETDDQDAAAVEVPPFSIRADSSQWASCIRVIDGIKGEATSMIELDENEAAFTLTTCVFHGQQGEVFLAVGTGKDVTLSPRSCACGFIRIYRFVNDGAELELIHTTQIEDVPTALCAFQGRLLAGVGPVLRIYDLGKKKLLRKCDNKGFPHVICNIFTQGDRIIVADVQESFHYVKYKRQENQLMIFADESMPRWVTAAAMIDYDSVAGADKFGNFFICRLPGEASDDIDDDPSASRILFEKGMLQGAAVKLNQLICFHIADLVTSINVTTLVPGGSSILVYTTISGAVGAFVPFTSKQDVDFFQHLEMHMRSELPSLLGRDHLMYRSVFHPVKNVIDGSLCEQFNALPGDKKRHISEELSRTVNDISKKLEDMHFRVAF